MNRKRLGVFALVLTMAMSVFTACGDSGGAGQPAAGDGSGTQSTTAPGTSGNGEQSTVVAWTWEAENHAAMYDAFVEEYPQYVMEFIPVEPGDMVQKLQTTLASGGQMPDIASLPQPQRGKFLEMDIWEDLSAEPYNFDLDTTLAFLLPKETSPSGKYIGPDFPGLGAMCYKRELTLEYFGTDDMDELEAMFPTWESMIEAGKQVQEKSGGEVFMMSSLFSYSMIYQGQTNTPYFIDNQMNLRESIGPAFDTMIEMKRSGTVDILEPDSPEEGASYADDKHIFYWLPNWGVASYIKTNDRNGEGRWGFMLPPEGPFTGEGCCYSIPNTALNKQGAADYIKFICSSLKGSELLRDVPGSFSPYKPTYEVEGFYSSPEPYFAGQDVLQLFADRVMPSVKENRVPTIYDADFNDAYNLALKTLTASDGNLTSEELITKMEQELMAKYPDLVPGN